MRGWRCAQPACSTGANRGCHDAHVGNAVQGGGQGQSLPSRLLTAQALWVVGANGHNLPSQLWGECLQVQTYPVLQPAADVPQSYACPGCAPTPFN